MSALNNSLAEAEVKGTSPRIPNPTLDPNTVKLITDILPDEVSSQLISVLRTLYKSSVFGEEIAALSEHHLETIEHSVNVAIISSILGQDTYKDSNSMTELMIASFLHDIGKTYTPLFLLESPNRLSPAEKGIIQLHPIYSYLMIKNKVATKLYNLEHFNSDINPLFYTLDWSSIALSVLQHHENVDSSGYVLNQTSDQIQPYAKIIHVADVFAALIEDRSYKHGWDTESAVQYIASNSGVMFEPKAVVALLQFRDSYNAFHSSTPKTRKQHTAKHIKEKIPKLQLENERNPKPFKSSRVDIFKP